MFGLYTPVLIFQIFCIYHAYKNNAEQRWYWLILFFPLGGSIIYLAYNFGSRSNIEKISETVRVVVNSNYRTQQLELALQHSDNITNRVNLADEYCNIGRFDDAIALYLKSLEGFMSDDAMLKMKLIRGYFLKQEFEPIIAIGQSMKNDKSFLASEERAAYAWALHHCGDSAAARAEFDQMDRPYTNYKQRIEYCRFLQLIGDKDAWDEKVHDLTEEFRFMKGTERKLHRHVIQQVESFQFSSATRNQETSA